MEVPDLVSTYGYCLKYHYFPTQSITNAVLTAVGDGIAQSEEAGSNDVDVDVDVDNTKNQLGGGYSYDPKRGLVYFFKGLGSGILWAWWFDFAEVWSMELTQSALSQVATTTTSNFQQQSTTEMLEFATGTSVVASTTAVLSFQAQAVRTAINIALEQFLVCPLLFTFWDIPVTASMRGSPLRQIPAQIREKLPPLFVANAKVWTGVNLVTYNIPQEYRLLFASGASIVSESINAGITSKRTVEEPPQPIVRTPVAVVATPRTVTAVMFNATAAF